MRGILLSIEFILAIIIIGSILLQPSKADALSGLVQGGDRESYFQKNKKRTKESVLIKITVISSLLFAINTIAINLL